MLHLKSQHFLSPSVGSLPDFYPCMWRMSLGRPRSRRQRFASFLFFSRLFSNLQTYKMNNSCQYQAENATKNLPERNVPEERFVWGENPLWEEHHSEDECALDDAHGEQKWSAESPDHHDHWEEIAEPYFHGLPNLWPEKVISFRVVE